MKNVNIGPEHPWYQSNNPKDQEQIKNLTERLKVWEGNSEEEKKEGIINLATRIVALDDELQKEFFGEVIGHQEVWKRKLTFEQAMTLRDRN